MKKKEKKGLLMVNTGNGKGKTTAALGQMLRAVGSGKRVCVIQFIKGSWKYGELFSVKRFDDLVDFHVMGKGFTFESKDLDEDRALALKGWQIAKQALESDAYFMVILDELTYLLNYGFLDSTEVLNALNQRRKDLHVVVTGRGASSEIIESADLVTEMQDIKHPYKAGVKAQKGIEF